MKEDKSKASWVLELGVYPGILFGMRTYDQEDHVTYVLYMPFVDMALVVFK
tara:strand:+ start:270 stop:422 length:153 start_codon:yes stop_codon:yes gene_type:complete